jgi:hypothetical protein
VSNRISGVMVSVLTSSVVDRGFGQGRIKPKNIEQFFSYIMARTCYFQLNYDMSTLHLDFYSISLLKQQSAGRHVGPLEHIIPITIQHRLVILYLRF